VETGRVEEKVVFGSSDQTFTYILETVDTTLGPHAELSGHTVRVRVSARHARQWAEGDDVGIEEHQPLSPDHCLHILIEKDFACLDRNDEQNEDTYPHPLAGQV